MPATIAPIVGASSRAGITTEMRVAPFAASNASTGPVGGDAGAPREPGGGVVVHEAHASQPAAPTRRS